MSHASIRCSLFLKKLPDYCFVTPPVKCAKNALMFGGGFQPVWTCECGSFVYMHVCACVLGDKSLMWMMDSPGVSMMSRRRRPRSSCQVGPISHSLTVNPLHSSFPIHPSASYKYAVVIRCKHIQYYALQPYCAVRISCCCRHLLVYRQITHNHSDRNVSFQRRHRLPTPASKRRLMKSPLR